MVKYDLGVLKDYFNVRLIKRKIPEMLIRHLKSEDIYLLSELGLPYGILDFKFDAPILIRNENEIVLGSLFKDIILNTSQRSIYLGDKSFFLAQNLKNFLLQLYVIDYFWEKIVKNHVFGNYLENCRLYAVFLQRSFLEVDSELLIKDRAYYWGSMIEDIEFGIVQ